MQKYLPTIFSNKFFSRQCSKSQPEYINISPGFKFILIPACPCLPVGSKYIGQLSPPKFKVVDISQEFHLCV